MLAASGAPTAERSRRLRQASTAARRRSAGARARASKAFADNWNARLEYLYVDLGNASGSLATPVIPLSGAPLVVGYRSHSADNILRFAVNYRFGGTRGCGAAARVRYNRALSPADLRDFLKLLDEYKLDATLLELDTPG